MLEAFITNLGRYNEGYLDGAYLKLPAEKEDVQALLKKIHVDGIRYEEIFITDYETDVPGLYDCLGEYESIDELNHLAYVLQEVEDQHDMDKFAAAVELGERTGSIKDLINLAQNLDCYYFYPDIKDEEDLGLYFVEELGALDIPDNLRAFFDFEAYRKAVIACEKLMEQLSQRLSKEDYELVQELRAQTAIAQCEESESHFKYGFSAGLMFSRKPMNKCSRRKKNR